MGPTMRLNVVIIRSMFPKVAAIGPAGNSSSSPRTQTAKRMYRGVIEAYIGVVVRSICRNGQALS